jgi:hypothetical protein
MSVLSTNADDYDRYVRKAMLDPIVICPKCKTEIRLTESLAAPLIDATREEFEHKLRDKDAEIRGRDEIVQTAKAELEKARRDIDVQIADQLAIERLSIRTEESDRAKRLLSTDIDRQAEELADLKIVLADRDQKLATAQQVQAEFMKKQREFDDAKREMDLTIEARIQDGLAGVRDKARKEAEDDMGLRVREKEELISGMQLQIAELRRRAEQGSQQLQGEVLELELEDMLRGKFPRDVIDAVPKGEHGGDLLHRVVSPAGQVCGTILWETKRTKAWSDGWLVKLRADQRAAKADLALIVSRTPPKGLDGFDLIDGIWVTEMRCAPAVAIALRETILALAAVRAAKDGQQTKTELIYEYLTGPRFRHRVEAIVEKFSEMQSDLDRERKTMTRLWAKREAQLQVVVEATAGMYGDLQGIAGQSLEEIEGLDLLLLESPDDKEI